MIMKRAAPSDNPSALHPDGDMNKRQCSMSTRKSDENDGLSLEHDKNGVSSKPQQNRGGVFGDASGSDEDAPVPSLCLPTAKISSLPSIRKRPRSSAPSGGVFGGASDSDSADDERPASTSRSRTRPISDIGVGSTNTHSVNSKSNATAENKMTAEDTLDAFMNALSDANTTKRRVTHASSPSSSEDEASFPQDSRNNKTAPELSAEEAARLADEAKRSLTLAPVDHESIEYPPLEKELYVPLERHASLTPEQLAERASQAGVQIDRDVCVIDTFADIALSISQSMLGRLVTAFDTPTPVQRAVFPAALAGHDVLANAPTGSGKTLAYIVPLLSMAAAAARSTEETGAKACTRAVVLAPTRELAAQIAQQARVYGGGERAATLVTGGTGKMAQVQALRSGSWLLIATPGRLIDLVKMKALSLRNVVVVAIDEADRMLDLGFGPQVHTILDQIRPDAQCLLLSATLPARVRSLATRVLNDPVRISVAGSKNGTPPAAITEHFVSLRDSPMRWQWLQDNLAKLTGDDGLVMIFCNARGDCAQLSNKLRAVGTPVACVHGETAPEDRVALLGMFRRREVRVLVSTDLAARGLDIAAVGAVVNYGAAKDWEAHVHRVGRTGRAGRTGDAYTLLACDSGVDVRFARKARDVLRKAKRELPSGLSQFLSASAPTKRYNERGTRERRQEQG